MSSPYDIVRSKVYVGANIYVARPVIALTLGLDVDEWTTRGSEAHLLAALDRALAGLLSAPAGTNLRDALSAQPLCFAELVAHLALTIQRTIAPETRFAASVADPDNGCRYALIGFVEPPVGLFAAQVAHAVLRQEVAAFDSRITPIRAAFSPAQALLDFQREAGRHLLEPNARAITLAAAERAIPWQRLNTHSPIVQLGTGRHQVRVDRSTTPGSSTVAVQLSCDKASASQLLAEHGLPVAPRILAHSLDEVVASGERLGYPLVVKPNNSGGGYDVFLDVPDEPALRSAGSAILNDAALGADRTVLIEKFIPGDDFRLLVIDGQVVSVVQRVPGTVTGDGRRTVEALVSALGISRFGTWLLPIQLDREALELLETQHLTPTCVPPTGQTVRLRRRGMLHLGAEAIDRTADVHPDVCSLAVNATRVLGLDVAGVDYLTPDISGAPSEVRGVICEVNAWPGLRVHLASGGAGAYAGHHFVDYLFPAKRAARIPVGTIVTPQGGTRLAQCVARCLESRHADVGVAGPEGFSIGSRTIVAQNASTIEGTRAVLRHTGLEAAVLNIDWRNVIDRGLGFTETDVVAIDDFGFADTFTPTDDATSLAVSNAARVVAQVTSRRVVLEIGHPDLDALIARSTAPATIVCLDATDELIESRVAMGNEVVRALVSGPSIALTRIDERGAEPWLDLECPNLAPRTALFAAVMAHYLDVSDEDICRSLQNC